jgi:hypothetical protein
LGATARRDPAALAPGRPSPPTAVDVVFESKREALSLSVKTFVPSMLKGVTATAVFTPRQRRAVL